MPGVINRRPHPTEQSLTLRLPWDMWIEIRDLGREHERPTSAEIRAAISSWVERHEHEKMMRRTYRSEKGEQDEQ